MKKAIVLILLALLLLTMVGCGGSGATEDADELLEWRTQEDQMAYMPDLLTLSEFLSVNDPVLFFRAREIDRRERPDIFYFHNGQLLVASGAGLNFGELSSMSDDEVIAVVKDFVQDQSNLIHSLEDHILWLEEQIPRIQIEYDRHGDAIDLWYLEDLTYRLAHHETELITVKDAVASGELATFFTTPYFLSVRADGTGNVTEFVTLHRGFGYWHDGGDVLTRFVWRTGTVNLFPQIASGIIYDATYVGFFSSADTQNTGGQVFVTRATNDFPQLVLNSPRSEGIETDVEAALARLEAELESRTMPR